MKAIALTASGDIEPLEDGAHGIVTRADPVQLGQLAEQHSRGKVVLLG
jgi:hypothetical protein